MDEPFRGFAYVHERVHPTRVESPFEHRGVRRSGWAAAVKRAHQVADRTGKPVYVDHLDNMWALWSGPVYEGQYTAADERHLVDLRRFRGRYMQTKVEPRKPKRDPRRRMRSRKLGYR